MNFPFAPFDFDNAAIIIHRVQTYAEYSENNYIRVYKNIW